MLYVIHGITEYLLHMLSGILVDGENWLRFWMCCDSTKDFSVLVGSLKSKHISDWLFHKLI